jgi:hypothetical protein
MPFIIFENFHDLWLKTDPKDVEKLQWRILEALHLPNINHVQVWNGTRNYQDLAAKSREEIGTVTQVILLNRVHRVIAQFIADEIGDFLSNFDAQKDSWIFMDNGKSKLIFHEGKMLGQKPENPTIPPINGSSNNSDDGSF